eukprot:7509513-Pyramimonas_sp.AAC.1
MLDIPLDGLDTQKHMVPARETMLDTPLNSLDTLKRVVLAQDNHVRYPLGWPGYVNARGSNSGQPC